MTPGARWGVSLTVGVLVGATSLVVRPVPAPPSPSALPPSPPLSPSAPPSPSPAAAPVRPSPSVIASPSRSATVSRRPSPSLRPIRVAATDSGNDLFGVEATACPTCASGSRVKYVGQGHGIVVHVRDVPAAGRRTLTIWYESEEARPLQVAVADNPVVTRTLPASGGWIVPARVRFPIDLPAGDSDLKLFHVDKPAPDLDQIQIG
jgi:hypothetical protein